MSVQVLRLRWASLGNSEKEKAMPVLRSLLFVPGNRPNMLEKALSCAPDAFVPDLEDSVPVVEKAREKVDAFLGFYQYLEDEAESWREPSGGAAPAAWIAATDAAFKAALDSDLDYPAALKAVIDGFNLLVLIAIVWALFRRIVVRPPLIPMNLDAGVILGAIGALMITHFLYHGFHSAALYAATGQLAPSAPVSNVLARAVAGIASESAERVEQLENDLIRYRELETLLRTTLVSAERAAVRGQSHPPGSPARRTADRYAADHRGEPRPSP